METLRQLQHHLPAFAFDAFKLTNGLLLLAIVFAPLERLFALRPQKFLRRNFGADIGYYFLSSLLPNRLLVLPMVAVAMSLPYIVPAGLHAWVARLTLPVRFVAALLVAEIGFYWGHRWMHEVSWLWRFHAVHHSAREMDWLVNTRAHPVDLVFIRLCGFVPLYLLGLAQPASNQVDWLPLLIALLGSMWGYFIHANVRWRLGWLQYLVTTPAFHHWHHVNAGPAHRNLNYAPVLPCIDALFGTFRLDKTWPGEYGIGSD